MRLLLSLLALLMLTACGPIYETQYSYHPPRSLEGRRCADHCKDTNHYCTRNCKLEEENCRSRERAEAHEEYRRYVHHQRAHNLPVKKEVSDFDHSYRCNDSGCPSRCREEYHACYYDCGGEISSKQVCTAFCN